MVFILLLPTAAPAAKRSAVPDAPRAADLVWPLPPDPPRIRFVREYHGEIDYRKKQGAFKRLLLGPEDEKPLSLRKPYGVTTDKKGRIYVTDTSLGALFIFDDAERSVRVIGKEGRTRLVTPVGVAVGDDGRIFVSDPGQQAVIGLDESGAPTMMLGGSHGMRAPSGIAIDRERRRLYVADAQTHQLFVYDTGGNFVATWGRRGSGSGEFNFPTNVALDQNGRVFVVDTGNFRVQVLDPDGKFGASFGAAGDGLGAFHRPKGIGLDSEGHVYVADAAFNNFQIFEPDGRLLLFVGATGQGPGSFWLPAGLHIDDSDRVYVVDQVNARVQVFQFLGEKKKRGEP